MSTLTTLNADHRLPLSMAIDFERQKFFWSRVEKDGDHLIWTGSSVPRGYGIITIDGDEVYAHRVSYCLAKNIDLKDIEDFIILRTCDRNDCVEPEHLIPKPKKKPPKAKPKAPKRSARKKAPRAKTTRAK